jgi:RNA polymerase sigma-70 factor (ECF subfamily)
METDAQQLVEAARFGNEAAAVQLIELFYRRINAFLRRLAGNEADAADLTQHTFSRVWQALPGFAGRASVSSWIHRIAYHTYVDWRRANHHSESRPDEWWQERPAAGPAPDESVGRTDLAARLYALVDQLEPTLRETIHLHYYQELTLQETAEAMNAATSTIKYRLRLALEQLQKPLTGDRPTLNTLRACKTI